MALTDTAQQREQEVRNAVPTNPAGQSTDLAAATASLIQTGSTSPKQATLINPSTGDKQVVVSGSEQAQQLFGQGYSLMGPDGQPAGGATPGAPATPTQTAAPTGTGTAAGAPEARFNAQTGASTPSRIASLRTNRDALRQQAFESVYSFTPEEWQNQPPSVQRELRRQRVLSLSNQIGDIDTAIEVAQQELEATKNDALTKLNTYLEYGVIGSLGEDELRGLADQAGLSYDAIASLSAKTEPPELRTIGGNLYAITFNPDTQQYETSLVLAAPKGSGGGGGRSAFQKDGESLREDIIRGRISFPDAFNSLKVSYPSVSNSQIDSVLGGSARSFDESTGEFIGQDLGTAALRPSDDSGGAIITRVLPDGSVITLQ